MVSATLLLRTWKRKILRDSLTLLSFEFKKQKPPRMTNSPSRGLCGEWGSGEQNVRMRFV